MKKEQQQTGKAK